MMNNQFCGNNCEMPKMKPEFHEMKPRPFHNEMPMTNPCCPQPIVLPEQVRVVNTYSCVEVPVVQPICTKVIENRTFVPRVYPVHKQTYETVCCQAPLDNKCC